MLGPLLFSIYCLGLDDIFKRHQLQYHMYADDTQLVVCMRRIRDPKCTRLKDRDYDVTPHIILILLLTCTPNAPGVGEGLRGGDG